MNFRKFTLMSLLAMTLSVQAGNNPDSPSSVAPSVEKMSTKDYKALIKAIKKECIAHAKVQHRGHVGSLNMNKTLSKSNLKKFKKSAKKDLKIRTKLCRDNFNKSLNDFKK